MDIKLITVPKQKTWGYTVIPGTPGHFYTGYVGYSRGEQKVGENVIITGDFHIDGMSRGRSAANFNGHFRDHKEIGYQLGMMGMADLILLIQSNHFRMVEGYIRGRWTLAKQGESVFLKPVMDA